MLHASCPGPTWINELKLHKIQINSIEIMKVRASLEWTANPNHQAVGPLSIHHKEQISDQAGQLVLSTPNMCIQSDLFSNVQLQLL
jgi:hypothetical protein